MTDGTTTWSYTYDGNGMRTSRTNGTKTYNYVYNGSQLTQMTVGNDTLYFTYGLLGPTTVTWNGETYYYALNGQGDVTGIFDEDGTLVVIYNWDNAWGYNPAPEGSLASTLGTLNPLRYRGYVYDAETGYYYLQSRYYDPEIGRFINSDAFVATGQGLLGNNMFAYCLNNPVVYQDGSGAFAFTTLLIAGAVSALISGVANAAAVAATGGTFEESLKAGLVGAAGGAAGFAVAALTGFSPGSAIVGRAISSTITDLGTAYVVNGQITGDDIAYTAVDVTMDCCLSTIGYYYTEPITGFVTNTAINAGLDGAIDVSESILFAANEQSVNTSKPQKTTTNRVRIRGRSILDRELLLY